MRTVTTTPLFLWRWKKQYDQAISAFQSFVKQYPKSTYQPNANYWLGQLFYNKGKKDDAAYYFAVVVKNYAKSPKAAGRHVQGGYHHAGKRAG